MLSSQVQCVLATVHRDNAPATALMAFAAIPNLQTIVLATPLAARKAQNMLERPAVSLLWDNRTGNASDHGNGLLVTASGSAALVKNSETAMAHFLSKNPEMSKFLESDGVGLFEVSIRTYEVVHGYDRPQIWDPNEADSENL